MNISTLPKNIGNYRIKRLLEKSTEEFLDTNGFLNIDLPVLSPALIPESYLEIFKTEFIFLDKKESLFLTPSPELFLKRLLVHDIGNCYYLGKSFRNSEPCSDLHSPEFTMLEFYKMNASYMDIADELLLLLKHLAMTRYGKNEIKFQGKITSFKKWEKISVCESFEKYAEIPSDILLDEEKFIVAAKNKGYVIEGFTYEDVFSQIYAQEVEKNLGQNGYPTLIYDYPKQFAALAKLNDDGLTAQRFEFYINGVELGDCYTELVDSVEQGKRFEDEDIKRTEAKKIGHPIDKGYVKALEYGLKPCAGIAIGFERLAMVFADADSIHDLKLIDID